MPPKLSDLVSRQTGLGHAGHRHLVDDAGQESTNFRNVQSMSQQTGLGHAGLLNLVICSMHF
jgi:hypothetical protein